MGVLHVQKEKKVLGMAFPKSHRRERHDQGVGAVGAWGVSRGL